MAALAFFLAIAWYWAARHLEFAADDFLILDNLQKIDGLRNAGRYFEVNFYAYFRPLVFLSFAVDQAIWGFNAAGFHLTNIFLHGVNTVLVYALVRRVGEMPLAGAAALFFAIHPVNQETVFWVSGRFDLLATAWILAALFFLWTPPPDRPGFEVRVRLSYWAGVACFTIALLSKESAAAVVILAPAYGVLVHGRDRRWAVDQLIPLLVVSVAYAVVRSQVGLAAVGGSQRLGKVLMLIAAVGVVLWLAGTRRSSPADRKLTPAARALMWAAAIGAVLTLLVSIPGLRGVIGPSLGFPTYAMYYLSPLSLAPATPAFLDPNRLAWVAGGVVGVSLAAGALIVGFSWLRARPVALLGVLMIGAALVPVSAMPGHTHLYLASVGAVLLAALAMPRPTRLVAHWAVMFVVTSLALASLKASTGAWQRSSDMTRGAVALVTSHPAPCAEREIVLLTAPSGVDGVPSNLNYETFRFLGGCVPRALHTLLRVMREDADVEATRPAPNVIELRVRHYRGNLVASEDLRNFRWQIRGDSRSLAIDTPIGRLESRSDGTSQLFRLNLTAEASRATFYYYSRRQLHAAPE